MVAPESGSAPTSNMVGPDAELRNIMDTMAGNLATMIEETIVNHINSTNLTTYDSPIPPHPSDSPSPAQESGQPSLRRAPPAGLLVGMDPWSPFLGAAGPRDSPALSPLPMGRLSPPFSQIMNHLVGLRGPAPQPSWDHDEWHRLMEMTMADTGGVKKVVSEEGLDQVKRWTFKQEEEKAGCVEGRDGANSPPLTCAITQMPFEDGDAVAEMPCGHKFDAESLTRWLQRESAMCPVCRHELPSREVARSPTNYDSDSSVEGSPNGPAPPPAQGLEDGVSLVLQPLLPQGVTLGVQGVPAGLLLMGEPGGPGFLFTRQRLEDQALQQTAEQEQQIEDDQIEAAILASVMRESMND